MLEFYPMPTNLNHGSNLYPSHHHHHQPNLGATRFLDNPTTTNGNMNVGNSLPTTLPSMQSPNQQATTTCSIMTQGQNNDNIIINNNNNCLNMAKSSLTAAPAKTESTSLQLIHNNNNNNSTMPATKSTKVASSCNQNKENLLQQQQQHQQHQNSCASLTSATSCTPTTNSCLKIANELNSAAVINSTSSVVLGVTKVSSSEDCNGRTDVDQIKCEKNFELCEGCGQKICDRYLMNVAETNWHENCLACCYCGMQLHQTCYVRNGKIYCKMDYDRLFAIKCISCCHPILPQDMVMRPLPNLIFHVSCFICCACRIPLQKGEQFLLRDGQILCFRHDLEKELFLAQHCGGYLGFDDDDLFRPRDGRRGPKRPRTILTSQQRKQFKLSFEQSPKPCRKVREALAKDTGLSVRVVQVWFQNQRAKIKKIQRKAKNGNRNGAGGAHASDDKDNLDKDGIKQEHGSGSENGYLGLDNSYSTQPLNPNLPFSPDDYPANSNDSFCSSDLSLDGSNFDHLDDDGDDTLSLNNLELQSTSSSSGHQNNNHHHNQRHNHILNSNPQDMLANLNNSLINPIDKLYLMQNSYFQQET